MTTRFHTITPDIPPIDNCCDKEAYAFFGFAAYYAQIVEQCALTLALALQLPEVHLITREFFDELYADLSKRTLGQLLKAARKVIAISAADRLVLDEALELRNVLIHHYFRAHAEDFVSVTGRHSMKHELQAIASKFQRAEAILERLYLPLYRQYGITDDFIEDELADAERRAKLRDEAT